MPSRLISDPQILYQYVMALIAQCVECESQFRPGITACPDCGGKVEEFEIEREVPIASVPLGTSLVVFFIAAAIVGFTETQGITNTRGDVPWQVPPIFAGVIAAAIYLFGRNLKGS